MDEDGGAVRGKLNERASSGARGGSLRALGAAKRSAQLVTARAGSTAGIQARVAARSASLALPPQAPAAGAYGRVADAPPPPPDRVYAAFLASRNLLPPDAFEVVKRPIPRPTEYGLFLPPPPRLYDYSAGGFAAAAAGVAAMDDAEDGAGAPAAAPWAARQGRGAFYKNLHAGLTGRSTTGAGGAGGAAAAAAGGSAAAAAGGGGSARGSGLQRLHTALLSEGGACAAAAAGGAGAGGEGAGGAAAAAASSGVPAAVPAPGQLRYLGAVVEAHARSRGRPQEGAVSPPPPPPSGAAGALRTALGAAGAPRAAPLPAAAAAAPPAAAPGAAAAVARPALPPLHLAGVLAAHTQGGAPARAARYGLAGAAVAGDSARSSADSGSARGAGAGWESSSVRRAPSKLRRVGALPVPEGSAGARGGRAASGLAAAWARTCNTGCSPCSPPIIFCTSPAESAILSVGACKVPMMSSRFDHKQEIKTTESAPRLRF